MIEEYEVVTHSTVCEETVEEEYTVPHPRSELFAREIKRAIGTITNKDRLRRRSQKHAARLQLVDLHLVAVVRYDNFAALALRDVKGLPVDLARFFAELFILLVLEGEGELELVLAPFSFGLKFLAVAGRVLAHGWVVLGVRFVGAAHSCRRTKREASVRWMAYELVYTPAMRLPCS